MKLKSRFGKKVNYLAFSFLIPFCGMLCVMLISGYKPFGKYSMLYSDCYHQYYPFFLAFRRALLSGESLLYNWSVGMGLDYLGLISYYLASPLNLLSVFVPESWLLSYFSLLVPIKLGLAGLFYGIFAKHLFCRDDFSLCLFSSFYALCAWALGFQWNIMWLDTFALLPLVVLGTISLIRERKFALYTISLFLAVYSNYYIGFFVCIFVALLFFCVEICRFHGWKRFFADLGVIAFFSALALGLTAFLLLPTYAALQTTQSSVNAFPTGFRLNIASENTWKGLLDAMRQVAGNMGGGIEPNFKEGLPNLYCGIGTIFLGVLYLFSGEIRLRDKFCAVSLLIFFNISFIIRQLDYIWHGFHFTNMIPYRFSFLYSFVLLYMAYRGWLLRRNRKSWQVACAGAVTLALLGCANVLTDTVSVTWFAIDLVIPVYLVYNVPFFILYLIAFLYGAWPVRIAPTEEEDAEQEQQHRQKIRSVRAVHLYRSRLIAWITAGLELAATLLAFGLYFPGTSVKNYPKGTEESASMIRYLHEREPELFYRTEVTHAQTLNDGALNNYNGISTFTSSANVKVTEFMKALGYGAKNTYNRYCFEESSPVANLFLNLKYMIDRDGKDKNSAVFQEVHHYGSIYLYENTAWLPLGFLTNSELADVDFFQSGNVFEVQNEIFTAMVGIEDQVWEQLTDENLSVTANGAKLDKANGEGAYNYSECEKNAKLDYAFLSDRDGFACIWLNLPKRNDFTVSVNGVEQYRETISLPQMLAVGEVKAGDVIDVCISCDEGESAKAEVIAATLDKNAFFWGYELLESSVLELSDFTTTRIAGSIECRKDGLLYTSVPQNGNWHLYIDGTEAELKLVGNCMISADITEGNHDILLVYRNRAFTWGLLISSACGGVFAYLVYRFYHSEFQKLRTHKDKRRKAGGKYKK